MSGWWYRRSRFTRLIVYAVAVILAFVMAASVGAMAALTAGGGLSWPTGERSRPGEPDRTAEQGKTPQRQKADADHPKQEHTHRSQQEEASADQEQTASQEEQLPYVSEVGRIQASSVEAFSDSHMKLLRYDTLTSGDIEEMQANQAALQGFADRSSDLEAPQKYGEQKEAFVSGIEELHQGGRLAYVLAADPIAASQADFDDYDRLANEAAADLQQSNEALGKDYETIAELQGVDTP
jgi:hypothetical protein